MNSDTTASLLEEHRRRSHWRQPLLSPVDETVVDLSVAVGTGAKTPAGSTSHPSVYPNNSRYLFDPSKYSGVGSLKQLTADIESCCPEC